MEAARIASLRGHKVTLFEKAGELGGAMLFCCTVPGKTKMRWHVDWLRRQVKNLGVDVKLKTEPDAKRLKEFDVVLLATGAKVVRPDIPGINLPLVVSFEDVLRCKNRKCENYLEDKLPPVECGDAVLIWGDSFGAADTAERLGHAGRKVYLVTRNREFAEWMEPCHRDVMMKRFNCGNGEGLRGKTYAHPVTIIRSSTITEINPDGQVVIMDNAFQRSSVKIDNVVLALVEKNDSLYESLKGAGIRVAKIGDAASVRNVRGAVTDGANAGLTLEKDAALNANNALVANLPTEIQFQLADRRT
jgi:pyruvate/2-oxoglutarate dehydrogenase complex dihydrolipoamide dehydrogenase (E3) component